MSFIFNLIFPKIKMKLLKKIMESYLSFSSITTFNTSNEKLIKLLCLG